MSKSDNNPLKKFHDEVMRPLWPVSQDDIERARREYHRRIGIAAREAGVIPPQFGQIVVNPDGAKKLLTHLVEVAQGYFGTDAAPLSNKKPLHLKHRDKAGRDKAAYTGPDAPPIIDPVARETESHIEHDVLHGPHRVIGLFYKLPDGTNVSESFAETSAVTSAIINPKPMFPCDTPEAPPTSFVPTPLQAAILKALDGRGLTKEKLAAEICNDDGSRLYKPGGIKELKELGLVRNKRTIGYYRPDAPPKSRD